MIIDTNGKLFEERRKTDRRKNEKAKKCEIEKRKKDRRDPKNSYKV